MRAFLRSLSLLVVALGCASSAVAAPTSNTSPANAMSLSASPSATVQISAARKAHMKALSDKAYTAAILAKDVTKVKALLIKDGAPSTVVVKINDQRPGGTGAAEKAKITITVTCCPLTITILIKL